MHPLFGKASGLTETIIAAAIEVHRRIGPGLIESIYEWCLPMKRNGDWEDAASCRKIDQRKTRVLPCHIAVNV